MNDNVLLIILSSVALVFSLLAFLNRNRPAPSASSSLDTKALRLQAYERLVLPCPT